MNFWVTNPSSENQSRLYVYHSSTFYTQPHEVLPSASNMATIKTIVKVRMFVLDAPRQGTVTPGVKTHLTVLTARGITVPMPKDVPDGKRSGTSKNLKQLTKSVIMKQNGWWMSHDQRKVCHMLVQ